jgi:hypothetical protein
MTLTRRHLLAGAAVLTLWPRGLFAAPLDQTEAMLALLPDREGAAKLGALWVQQAHKEPGEILASLQQKLHPSADADAAAFRRDLANAIGDDFRSGAVVKLEGWQLARTQAELCALAYFAAAGRV